MPISTPATTCATRSARHLLRAHVDPFGPVPANRLADELRSIPHLRQPTDFDFAAWYRGAYGARLDPMAGTPCGTGPASAIVKFESIARTRNLARLIDANATPGAVVLVEAGANHWLALRDYLDRVLTDGQAAGRQQGSNCFMLASAQCASAPSLLDTVMLALDPSG